MIRRMISRGSCDGCMVDKDAMNGKTLENTEINFVREADPLEFVIIVMTKCHTFKKLFYINVNHGSCYTGGYLPRLVLEPAVKGPHFMGLFRMVN